MIKTIDHNFWLESSNIKIPQNITEKDLVIKILKTSFNVFDFLVCIDSKNHSFLFINKTIKKQDEKNIKSIIPNLSLDFNSCIDFVVQINLFKLDDNYVIEFQRRYGDIISFYNCFKNYSNIFNGKCKFIKNIISDKNKIEVDEKVLEEYINICETSYMDIAFNFRDLLCMLISSNNCPSINKYSDRIKNILERSFIVIHEFK